MAAIAPPLLIDLTSEPAVDPSAFLAKLTPTKSSIKKTWDERVAAAEEARKYFLAGRTIRAACLSKRKHAVPEAPSAELLKKIVERLREAEIRRDIEQEAVKFKAAACRRASPLKFKQAQHAARAIRLRVKLVEATQRRNEHLEAVRTKAARSPPRSPEKRERAAQTFDLGDVCKKLADAGDRRDAILAAKVDKAKKLAEKRRVDDGQAAPSTVDALASKLGAAERRRGAILAGKVEKAKALGSPAKPCPPPPPTDAEAKRAAAAERRAAYLRRVAAKAKAKDVVAPEEDVAALRATLAAKLAGAAARAGSAASRRSKRGAALGTDAVLAAAVRALRVTAKSAELAKALDAKHGAAAARRAAAADVACSVRSSSRAHLGGTRVIQRRFNVSVPRARVPETASTRRGRSER